MGKQVRKSAQEKQRILEETKTLGLVETARKYELSYKILKDWQDIAVVFGLEGLKSEGSKLSPTLKRLQLENQSLKELVAVKELELKIMNELLKKNHSKSKLENDSYDIYRPTVSSTQSIAIFRYKCRYLLLL